MDFMQFDSKGAADKGAWMHARSPLNGELLWADDGKEKPCRVKVLGIEGKVGQELLEGERRRMKDEGDEGSSSLVEQTAKLVGGFENISRGNSPAEAPKDVEWFLGLQEVVGGDLPSFVEQVRAFAVRRANILGNVSSG